MSPVGLLVLVEKISGKKFAAILDMCTKLHFAQLCKIWTQSDNLDFSLFHGVPPLRIFRFLSTDILWINPKGGPHEKVKNQCCPILLKFSQILGEGPND